MSTQIPFSLRIFVADGDPDGLRTVERSNWNGKALIFPRALYTQVRNRPEFELPGVYLLLGPRTDGSGEKLYVGEGDPLKPRFEQHFANKDFWNRAVFFVAGPGQLNKAHVQFLEAQLVSRAKAAKQMPLDNANSPTEPTLSEADRADMEVFLHHILGMLPVLSIHAFEQSAVPSTSDGKFPLLNCQARGASATGQDTPQGFVIHAGSLAVAEEAPSLKQHFPYITKLRADLISSGVLVPENGKLRFAQDYTFTSPSLASSVVAGGSSNGRSDWRDGAGKTLKQIQEAQAQG
jgi:hypothetical protein